jgi:hypothetical protein
MNAEDMTADEVQDAAEAHSSFDTAIRHLAFGSASLIVALCAALLLHQLATNLGALRAEAPQPALHHASDRVSSLLGLHPVAGRDEDADARPAGGHRRDVRYCLNLPHPDTRHRCTGSPAN